MDIQSIKRIGFFDNVTVSGYLSPFCAADGCKIYSGETFNNSVFANKDYIDNNTPKIKLVVLGERGNKTYTIAYSDIIIIRDTSKFILNKQLSGKDKLKSEDINILESTATLAKVLDNKMMSKCAAIVDKVYVNEQYRHLGISSWLHTNMADILQYMFCCNVGIISLTYGDFSGEAQSKFGMDYTKYKKYLHDMYTNLGYKDVSLLARLKGTLSSDILYKLVNTQ